MTADPEPFDGNMAAPMPREALPAPVALRRFVLGVTGASGSIYGARLLHHLRLAGAETHLVLSEAAEQVTRFEGHPFPKSLAAGSDGLAGGVVRHRDDDLFAGPASGSFRHGGMVVAPCSAGTMGRIAAGTGDTLLLRAADVCIKERRPLVLLLRETPLSLIHLRNAAALTEAGALVMPATPEFYTRPRTLEELADGLVFRILDHLGIPSPEARRWREENA